MGSTRTLPALVAALVFGAAVPAQIPHAVPGYALSVSSVADGQGGLLAAYHAIQFSSARDLQRRLVSERTRHANAVNKLRRAYRTSMTALRRTILELGVRVAASAVPSHRVPAFETNGPAFAGPGGSASTKVAGASAASVPTGGGEAAETGNRTVGIPTQDSSTGATVASDGAVRALLQDANPVEPTCSMDELMAVQADPMGAVVGLFTTNPSCATCLVPCASASDAVSCAMGCLKQARGATLPFSTPWPCGLGTFVKRVLAAQGSK
jgi:hypothetical protein